MCWGRVLGMVCAEMAQRETKPRARVRLPRKVNAPLFAFTFNALRQRSPSPVVSIDSGKGLDRITWSEQPLRTFAFVRESDSPDSIPDDPNPMKNQPNQLPGEFGQCRTTPDKCHWCSADSRRLPL